MSYVYSGKCKQLVNGKTVHLKEGDIAREVGYNNLGFFYKKFKSVYEMTPFEYRNKWRL